MVKRAIALLLAAGVVCSGRGSAAEPSPAPIVLPVVPLPRESVATGDDFALPRTPAIEAADPPAGAAAGFLIDFLRARGVRAHVVARTGGAATIHLTDGARDPQLGAEGYRLETGAAGVTLTARGGAGLFYGVQTLEQLARFDGRGARFSGARILDRPAYRWRGIHLDVSRHFFSVPVVERYIDLAARYKLNIFHWHLTDDQGWRLPIARYPRLTSVGGCRAASQVGGEGSTLTDGRPTCGAYSRAQIRAVVAFAALRHVTIVPELEMPGHSVEALAAYPWLGCDRGPFAVRRLWGISTEIFCPTERTFAFLDDVLRETAQLFPGPYVHIGGDEVPKDAWRRSPAVAALMRRRHLATYDAVQGYFTRRVERIAAKYRRRIVGWDDIAAGGVSRKAIVMVWHTEHETRAALRRGNEVVICPDPPLYFDAYQGDPDQEPPAIGGATTFERVHRFDPLPAGITTAQRAHVLGVQANLWTEYVPTPKHLFYMAFPRELALADVAWSPRSRLDWNDFVARSGPALARLEADGIPFRIPPPAYRVGGTTIEFPEQQDALDRTAIAVDATATVELRQAIPDATIRYTLDGSLPTTASPVYAAPLTIARGPSTDTLVRAIVVLPDGRRSVPSTLVLEGPH